MRLKLFFISIGSLLAVFFFLTSSLVSQASLNFTLSIWLFSKFKKNPFAVIPFFLLCFANYSVLVGWFLVPSVAPVLPLIIDQGAVDDIALLSIWIFMAVLAFSKINDRLFVAEFDEFHELAGFGLIFLGAFMCIYFLNTEGNDRATYSPIYEYAYVPFLLGAFFLSSSTRGVKWLVISVLLFFSFRDLYHGNRVPGLQFGLVAYVVFFRDYYSLARFYLFAMAGFVLMTVVSALRYALSVSEITIGNVFELITSGWFTFDTSVYAYVSSLTLVSTSEMTSFERLPAINDFIANQLLGRGAGLNAYQLAATYYTTIGGAWLPLYIYFYFGLFGVVAAGFYLRFLFSLSFSKGRFQYLVFLFVIVTSPRWLFYSSSPLLRGLLIMITMYSIINLVIFFIKRAIR
jgi:hypothetical protein